MAKRQSLRAEPRITQKPRVEINQENLGLLTNISKTFNRFQIEVDQKLDRQAVIDGTRKGIEDGQDGRFDAKLLYAPTIYGERYTASAIQQQSRMLDITTKTRLHEIAARNQFDPVKVKEQGEAYIKERAANMDPNLDPAVAKDYLLSSQLSVNTIVQQSNSRLVDLERSSQKAGVIRYNRDRTIEIDRVASSVLSGNTDERIAAMQELFSIRNGLAESYHSIFKDNFGNEHPVFSPEQAAIAIENFNAQFRESAVKGWFLSQKSKLSAIQMFAGGELKQEVGDPTTGEILKFEPLGQASPDNVLAMTGEEIKTTIQWMRGQVTADIGLRRNLQAVNDKQTERLENDLEITYLNEENPQTRKVLAETIARTSTNPKQVERILKQMSEIGPQGFTAPGVINQLFIDIADGDVDNPTDLSRYVLSNDDYRTFAKMLLGRRNSGHITSSKSFKSAVDMIYLEMEGETAEGYGRRAVKVKNAEVARIHGDFLRKAMDAQDQGTLNTFNPRAEAAALMGNRGELKEKLAAVSTELSSIMADISELSVEIKTTKVEGFNPFRGYMDPEKDPRIKTLKEKQAVVERDQAELKRRLNQ